MYTILITTKYSSNLNFRGVILIVLEWCPFFSKWENGIFFLMRLYYLFVQDCFKIVCNELRGYIKPQTTLFTILTSKEFFLNFPFKFRILTSFYWTQNVDNFFNKQNTEIGKSFSMWIYQYRQKFSPWTYSCDTY